MVPLSAITISAQSYLVTTNVLVKIRDTILHCSKSVFSTSSFDIIDDKVKLDNCANVNIFNEKKYFKSGIQPCAFDISIGTIGGNEKPTGIGHAGITWRDAHGKLHNRTLRNSYYYPNSPINVCSVLQLVIQDNDLEGTSIQTFAYYSIFRWKRKNFILN